MNVKLLLTTTCVSLGLGGCATVKVTEQNPPNVRVGQEPAIGAVATTPVGGSVFSQYRFLGRTVYRFMEPVTVGFALGRISVNAGDTLAKATFDGKSGYCTERFTYIDPLVGPHATSCYVEGEPGIFSAVSVSPGMVWMSKSLPNPVRFERADMVMPGSNSFKYELLYQGLTNKSLRLSYREYSNDMARPAFFQDVSYDVASFPTIIAFKNVKIEVLNASNNGLTYKVLSPF